jgi:hypothetical protein
VHGDLWPADLHGPGNRAAQRHAVLTGRPKERQELVEQADEARGQADLAEDAEGRLEDLALDDGLSGRRGQVVRKGCLFDSVANARDELRERDISLGVPGRSRDGRGDADQSEGSLAPIDHGIVLVGIHC